MKTAAVELHVVRYGELRDPGPPPEAGADDRKIASLLAHPLARPEDVAAVLLMCDGRVAGHFWLVPGRIRIAGATYPVWYGSDYDIVDPSVGAAHAGALFLRALREARSLGVFAVSPEASRVYRAARLDVRVVPRRTLVLRVRGFVERRSPSPVLSTVASLPIDALLALTRAPRLRGVAVPRGMRLVPVARFGDEVDAIDGAARGEHALERGHTELDWAIEHPWLDVPKYRWLPFHLHAGNHVAGYALVRIRTFGSVTVGSIMRSAVEPGVAGGREAMLRLLVDALGSAHVDVMDMCTDDPLDISIAQRLGMIARGDAMHGLRLGGDAAQAAREHGVRFEGLRLEMGEGDALLG